MKNVYRQRWLSLVCLGCGAAGAPTPAAVVAPASQGAEAPRPSGPSPVLEYRGFAKPESVLYDSNHDRYLVSNVNGEPGASAAPSTRWPSKDRSTARCFPV